MACFCVFVAGNALGDPIEIVPARGSTISTNINQARPAKKDFEAMMPGPQHPFNPDDLIHEAGPEFKPPPSTRTLSPREKELLDRRRNWVFMTPEELISGESNERTMGTNRYDADGSQMKPMTAMERWYYDHLIEPGRNNTRTNQFGKDSDSSNTDTNTLAGGEQNAENVRPFGSPFNTSPGREVSGNLQPMRPNSFSDVFGTSPDSEITDPETIAAKKEQKAHMESFKQLWNIDQPSAPPAASLSSSGLSGSSTSGSSISGFGTGSFPSMQPVLGTISSSSFGSSARATEASTQPAPTPVHAPPPRPNFTIKQRQF